MPLAKIAITRQQLVMYAGASGDFNPIHYDDEFARQVGLPGVIAHGMLSVGFVAQHLGNWAGPHGRVSDLKVRFVNMVRPGDELTCRARVERTAADSADLAIWVDKADGTPVITGTAQVCWP